MRKIGMLFGLMILLAVHIPWSAVSGEVPETIVSGDLIRVTADEYQVDQYEEVSVYVFINSSIDRDDVTVASNVNDWVKGSPPVSDQIQYSNLSADIETDRMNSTLRYDFDISDQMIWFDGERMLDNITVTLTFMAIHNGSEDLETITLTLRDVNDPPVIRGEIVVVPSEIEVGDRVTMTVDDVFDPDMDQVEIRWDPGEGGSVQGPVATRTFTRPGTFSIEVTADDGDLADTAMRTIEVLPPPEKEEEEKKPEPSQTQGDDGGPSLPWFLVPILLLIIIVVAIAGSMIGSSRGKEDEEPPKNLWSLSPMRGATRYEKAVMQARMRSLEKGRSVALEDERVLEEDLRRWDLDWDFETGS